MENYILVILGAMCCPLLTLAIVLGHYNHEGLALIIFCYMIIKWAISDKEKES